jgi:hypothetical protein
MKNRLNRIITFFSVLAPGVLFSQENVNMNVPQGLRANDKIWVVMLVCLTILFGLMALLIRLDRKLHRLENNSEK